MGLLERSRSVSFEQVCWSEADLALVDEARALLGPRRPRRGGTSGVAGDGQRLEQEPESSDAAPRAYGHIVVDEAQDLSPMQLRMLARRSISGSITLVGDLAQAIGPWTASGWEEVTRHLSGHKRASMVELSVSYRTPEEVLELSNRLLPEIGASSRPPVAVRRAGAPPRIRRSSPERLGAVAVAEVAELATKVGRGTLAVIVAPESADEMSGALGDGGLEFADLRRDPLGSQVSLLPAHMANGLEFDAVVVMEPAEISGRSVQGLRMLYVALTRPTRYLSIIHARELPDALSGMSGQVEVPGGRAGNSL